MHPSMISEEDCNEKHALQARSLMKKNAPQARLIKQNALQAGFFDSVLMSPLSY